MRVCALSLLFAVAVTACDDDNKVSDKPDLSTIDNEGMDMAGADLSVNGNDDMSMADLAVPVVGIAGVRAAAAKNLSKNTPDGGTLTMSIPVKDVYVTYIRPEVAGENDDPPGFFVQAVQTGPAVFVRINPADLTPSPLVGDLVQFTATGAILDSGSVANVTYLTDWSVESSGTALTSLVQDLSSATDLVTKIGNYESELATITGVLSGSFSGSGNAYVAAFLTTAGLPGPTGQSKLRVPSTLRDALDITNGCQVSVGPTPVWRFGTSAEVSGWVDGDIAVSSCPAPQVVSAIATDATHVVLTFDRFPKPASLLADGSQFTFDNGLTADVGGAILSAPGQVTINTSAQASGTAYTVTVAASLTDTRGTAIDAAHNSAAFAGFTQPAKLIINEYNYNITVGSTPTGNWDLVELKAVQGGSIAGFKLYEDFTTSGRTLLTTLPNNLILADGDFVLVHIGVLTPSPSPVPIVNEFNIGNAVSGKDNQQSQCVNTTCAPHAWDLAATTNSQLPASRRLISIVGGDGVVQDAVAFSVGSGTPPAIAGTELQAAIDGNFWTTPCVSPAPTVVSCASATGTALGTLVDTSAYVAKGATAPASTSTGASVQRKSAVQPSGQNDWQTKAETWGAEN
jgi:hypothetical protein